MAPRQSGEAGSRVRMDLSGTTKQPQNRAAGPCRAGLVVPRFRRHIRRMSAVLLNGRPRLTTKASVAISASSSTSSVLADG